MRLSTHVVDNQASLIYGDSPLLFKLKLLYFLHSYRMAGFLLSIRIVRRWFG